MKPIKYLPLIALFLGGLWLAGCKGNSDPPELACNVDNPLTDLPWLKDIIDGFEKEAEEGYVPSAKVYQCTYKDGAGFLIEPCVECLSSGYIFTNCEGTTLCEMKELDEYPCPELNINFKNKKLIWAINDIDMSNIDFSNIEDLYAQPLSVIHKCIQGKWYNKVQSCSQPECITWPCPSIVCPKETYIEINGYQSNFIDVYENHTFDYSFDCRWKECTILDRDKEISFKAYVLAVQNDKGDDRLIHYFQNIKNDSLYGISRYGPSFLDKIELRANDIGSIVRILDND